MEPPDLTALCRDAKTAWSALGKVDYGMKSSEQANIKFRRSLYFVKALKAGDVITANAVRSVRPGYGIAPKFVEHIVGKKVVRNIEKNSPVCFDDLEP